VKVAAWSKNPIDRFLLNRLEREGLQPAPEASRETLVRRVTLDLTGLPPTPGEVEAFLGDLNPAAYERQVERFAPGFRDRILARSVLTPADLERRNANLIGGDINGGMMDLRQVFARPVARPVPYRTPLPGVYICSASTPPGGGVHGMGGYHAARAALARVLR